MIHGIAIAQGSDGSASSTAALWAIVLPAVIAAVFGALTGWIGAYLRVKAENFATKQEFEEALQRLAENTRIVGEENARIARQAALNLRGCSRAGRSHRRCPAGREARRHRPEKSSATKS